MLTFYTICIYLFSLHLYFFLQLFVSCRLDLRIHLIFFLKAKTVLFYVYVFCNLKSFSVFVLFPDIDILKNTASYSVEWLSIWMFVFLFLEVSQWRVFLSVHHTRRHMMLIYPITSDFNIDHLVKVASASFFLLIRMYLVGMYFEMYGNEGSCKLTN